MTAEQDDRLTAVDIFRSAISVAEDDVGRPARALILSGVAGGIGMGLTPLGVGVALDLLGTGGTREFVGMMFYPLGFIVVIIGRAQLFTENTLFPVALSLHDRDHLRPTARLWIAVFVGNIMGALIFALLIMKTGAIDGSLEDVLTGLGIEVATSRSWGGIFWSGVVGGWIIALAAWLVTASRHTIGQVVVIWLLTFIVGAGNFAHSIAGAAEILTAVVGGGVQVTTFLGWLAAATLGNALGGVVIVTLLNYGQVRRQSGSGA